MLYRGEVVEAGDPEQVVKHPQHAYTQLLIGSIPQPDPERAWAAGPLDDDDEEDLAEAAMTA